MKSMQPIKYFGGKGTMLGELKKRFPVPGTYKCFVDAYGGSGVVVLNIASAPVKVYNDLEGNVYHLFKVLQNPETFAQFQRLANLSFYDERTSNEYRLSLRHDEMTPLQRAFRFWYVNRTRHNGMGGFSSNSTIRRGMSKATSDYLAAIDGLPELHQCLKSIIIQNRDALNLIPKWDREDTFMYLDPPYLHETRGTARYKQDADNSHHEQLIEILLEIKKARVMLSGYRSPLYVRITDKDWRREDFVVHTVDGARKKKDKIESVWMNYPPPQPLLL